MIIGIDPGNKGGISILDEDGNLIFCMPMPVKKFQLKTKTKKGNFRHRTEVDIGDLRALMESSLCSTHSVWLEEVHSMPQQGVTSMFNFGMGYGMLIGWFEGAGLKVYRVPSHIWKGNMLKGLDRSEKETSINKAIEMTGCDFKATPRSKNGHDGMAESYLIAYYGYKKYLVGIDGKQI